MLLKYLFIVNSFPLVSCHRPCCFSVRHHEISPTRLKTKPPCPCVPPDLVSHKSGAVEIRADRMPLIDTNAEVGINGWDALRFVLRFFF